MAESGNGREIEVRSLTGESVRVRIEPNNAVQDLKLLLKQCFASASSSSNFHLFLKAISKSPFLLLRSGEKLRLKSQIGSYSIGDENFLVLTPLLKKDRVEGADARLSENPNASESLETESADSAWVELMEDLSSLRDAPNFETPPVAEMESVNFVNVDTPVRRMSSRLGFSNGEMVKCGSFEDPIIVNLLRRKQIL